MEIAPLLREYWFDNPKRAEDARKQLLFPSGLSASTRWLADSEFGCQSPNSNIWYMLLYAWNKAEWRHYCGAEIERAPTLDALLANILARLVQQRLRIGLGRSYVDKRELLRGLRGRVNFTQSLKRMAFEKAQAFCEFQEFSTNAPKNQIVRTTLRHLVQVGRFGAGTEARELRESLRRLIRDMEGLDFIEIGPVLIHRTLVGRNDADYALMLNICDLILMRNMPTEEPGYQKVPGIDRDTLTLHAIYERFVASFCKTHLSDWSVSSQETLRWPATRSLSVPASDASGYSLRHRNPPLIVVIDTKFTPDSLVSGQFGNLRFDSGHLYQMYAYLRSQEQESAERAVASGMLLYPTVSRPLCEIVELQAHRITFQTIDLSLPWPWIHESLLAIVGRQLEVVEAKDGV